MSKKRCDRCGDVLADNAVIVMIGEGIYNEIPSRVNYKISVPYDIYEVWHKSCYLEGHRPNETIIDIDF